MSARQETYTRENTQSSHPVRENFSVESTSQSTNFSANSASQPTSFGGYVQSRYWTLPTHITPTSSFPAGTRSQPPIPGSNVAPVSGPFEYYTRTPLDQRKTGGPVSSPHLSITGRGSLIASKGFFNGASASPAQEGAGGRKVSPGGPLGPANPNALAPLLGARVNSTLSVGSNVIGNGSGAKAQPTRKKSNNMFSGLEVDPKPKNTNGTTPNQCDHTGACGCPRYWTPPFPLKAQKKVEWTELSLQQPRHAPTVQPASKVKQFVDYLVGKFRSKLSWNDFLECEDNIYYILKGKKLDLWYFRVHSNGSMDIPCIDGTTVNMCFRYGFTRLISPTPEIQEAKGLLRKGEKCLDMNGAPCKLSHGKFPCASDIHGKCNRFEKNECKGFHVLCLPKPGATPLPTTFNAITNPFSITPTWGNGSFTTNVFLSVGENISRFPISIRMSLREFLGGDAIVTAAKKQSPYPNQGLAFPWAGVFRFALSATQTKEIYDKDYSHATLSKGEARNRENINATKGTMICSDWMFGECTNGNCSFAHSKCVTPLSINKKVEKMLTNGEMENMISPTGEGFKQLVGVLIEGFPNIRYMVERDGFEFSCFSPLISRLEDQTSVLCAGDFELLITLWRKVHLNMYKPPQKEGIEWTPPMDNNYFCFSSIKMHTIMGELSRRMLLPCVDLNCLHDVNCRTGQHNGMGLDFNRMAGKVITLHTLSSRKALQQSPEGVAMKAEIISSEERRKVCIRNSHLLQIEKKAMEDEFTRVNKVNSSVSLRKETTLATLENKIEAKEEKLESTKARLVVAEGELARTIEELTAMKKKDECHVCSIPEAVIREDNRARVADEERRAKLNASLNGKASKTDTTKLNRMYAKALKSNDATKAFINSLSTKEFSLLNLDSSRLPCIDEKEDEDEDEDEEEDEEEEYEPYVPLDLTGHTCNTPLSDDDLTELFKKEHKKTQLENEVKHLSSLIPELSESILSLKIKKDTVSLSATVVHSPLGNINSLEYNRCMAEIAEYESELKEIKTRLIQLKARFNPPIVRCLVEHYGFQVNKSTIRVGDCYQRIATNEVFDPSAFKLGLGKNVKRSLSPEWTKKPLAINMPPRIPEVNETILVKAIPVTAGLDTTPEAALEAVPEVALEVALEAALEAVPEVALEAALEAVPEVALEAALEAVPEVALEAVPEVAMIDEDGFITPKTHTSSEFIFEEASIQETPEQFLTETLKQREKRLAKKANKAREEARIKAAQEKVRHQTKSPAKLTCREREALKVQSNSSGDSSGEESGDSSGDEYDNVVEFEEAVDDNIEEPLPHLPEVPRESGRVNRFKRRNQSAQGHEDTSQTSRQHRLRDKKMIRSASHVDILEQRQAATNANMKKGRKRSGSRDSSDESRMDDVDSMNPILYDDDDTSFAAPKTSGKDPRDVRRSKSDSPRNGKKRSSSGRSGRKGEIY